MNISRIISSSSKTDRMINIQGKLRPSKLPSVRPISKNWGKWKFYIFFYILLFKLIIIIRNNSNYKYSEFRIYIYTYTDILQHQIILRIIVATHFPSLYLYLIWT
jgi:hypothetical protein